MTLLELTDAEGGSSTFFRKVGDDLPVTRV
jgi:hypothetical protein